MKPSPFWETKLKLKRQCLSEASLNNFRRNQLGKHIDDNNDYDAFRDVEARVRQQWNHLRGHIAPDLMHLVEDVEIGKPNLYEVAGKRVTVGSIEFAYMASRLRQYVGKHTCEIGGGYGGLARAMLMMQPHHYTIIDFPEVEAVQRRYLADYAVKWTLPGEDLPHADLYINTRSFFEMTLEQVAWYIEQMKGPAVFFSLNKDKVTRMRDWPIPKSWEKLEEHKSPVNQTMLEQVWRIP